MKKKPELEADLDPRGTRHTRPGSKAADAALANARPAVARKQRTATTASKGAGGARSGTTARAGGARKPARKRGR